jgi:hypothetical protein
MHSKTTLALTAMAMASGSLAFNHHRHLDAHAHVNKIRDLEARGLHTTVEWVTVYETVTLYKNGAGEVKTAGPNTYFANTKPDKEEPVPAAASPEPEAPKVDAAAQAPAQAPAPPAPAETKAAPASDEKTNGAAPPAAPAGGKRGFAYNDCGLVNSFATGGGSGVTWAYNWDSHHNGLAAPVNYVPMLWGNIPEHTNRWRTNADKMISSGSTHLLSFNEPDHPDQSNMSPESAAQAHVEYMNEYAGRARIGSPAITNSNIPGQSTDWLKNWVNACKGAGCVYDFCVAHWYSQASTPSFEVKAYLDRVHDACEGKPVWLTEFAPSGSDEEVAAFLKENLQMFDGLGYLERYSYFMMSVGSLMQSPNTPSHYGATYFGMSA